ncbi:MAG: TIGR04283 family arsenosugar biosynthesis glycosyltransferase [Bacteroidota bacterium]|nr:TIGR04283 family arsenosugar biosynthesis glycosyltransferase [Bacteroidota bacterium]
MQISIIIPVYNEAEHIGELIRYLLQYKTEAVAEIIVVDAGSTDDTLLIANNAGAAGILSPQKGRAAQMHYAASLAKGDVLYFVHADTFPPASFVADISKAIEDGFAIGRYRTQFNSRKWYLKINAWFTRFDWFICMGGDQTLFITRDLYMSAGGFKTDMLIMEEYEFVSRAREKERYKIFNKPTLVSARKYDTNSWWKVQMTNRKIVSMYKNGASQVEMVHMYKKMLNYR